MKQIFISENITDKHQFLNGEPVNWPKDSQKHNFYINKEEMYDFIFVCFLVNNQKQKDFKRYCCNVRFLHIWKQLTDKIVDDLKREHQQAIETI